MYSAYPQWPIVGDVLLTQACKSNCDYCISVSKHMPGVSHTWVWNCLIEPSGAVNILQCFAANRIQLHVPTGPNSGHKKRCEPANLVREQI